MSEDKVGSYGSEYEAYQQALTEGIVPEGTTFDQYRAQSTSEEGLPPLKGNPKTHQQETRGFFGIFSRKK